MLWLGLAIGTLVGALVLYFFTKDREGRALTALSEQHSAEKNDLLQRLASKEEALEKAQREVLTLTASVATETQRNRAAEEKLASQKQELTELQARLTHEFKVIADTILEEKGRKLNEQQHQALGSLIKPLQDRIVEFKKQVEEAYEKEGRERFALKGEIARLVEQNQKLSADADNLTKALKGDSKVQGDWGEMVLEKLLEASGLVKGQEYSMQESSTLSDGSRLRPDAVIFLPEGKHLIIDAKVSLLNYERAVAATDEAERSRLLKAHVESLRAHAKGLHEKDYSKLYGVSSVDFVLMYVPIEPAFLLALRERPEIFQEAYDRQVVMVTHSTLMATLRTIHSIWKNERISRNHLEIAERAGVLYDKFVGFTDDMKKVGQQLNTAQGTYVEAMKKLSTGAGNLVRQTEMLKALGAKTNKTIDPALLNRALEQAQEG